jgi:hypothetical protein
MNVSDYSVQLLHQDRLRDAANRRAQNDLIRDANEPAPNVIETGLLQNVRQWLQARSHQPQENADVRRAHAM